MTEFAMFACASTGRLKRKHPDETRQVSLETIYRTLFIQARGTLKKELLQHLRRTPGCVGPLVYCCRR